jgi:hypothetical protein
MEETTHEFFQQLLRLEKPWRVTAVEKDLTRETVTVCIRPVGDHLGGDAEIR